MTKWTAFLNSLSTRGGAIFILCVIVLSVDLSAFIIYLMHDLSFQGLASIAGSGAFTGALLIALKGSSDTSVTASSGPSGSLVTTATETTAAAAPDAKLAQLDADLRRLQR